MKRLFTTLLLITSLGTAQESAAHFRRPDVVAAAVQPAKAISQKAKPASTQAVLSAQDIARMLEQQVLAGEGVSMKFKIKDGENVSVVADVKSKKVRIETASMTIVSDGQTVYNYQKRNNQLTIDALGKGRPSALSNPKDLFLFATNYSTKVVSSKGNAYVIALTPNQTVKNALNAAGGINGLTFSVNVINGKLTIKSASAQSNGQNVETGAMTVKSLKTLKASEFAFNAPKGAKVIDLRE
ncbi:MAG TPA: hypothetical protein VFH43_08010 [Candidatus Kapabacteria bacterium]|nr:hypothetical protein [Candidatus Kapabacteria bacterium]